MNADVSPLDAGCPSSPTRPWATGGQRHLGRFHDLSRIVKTHLFVIAPNNSGSTFLSTALASCQGVWSLPAEARDVAGYVGPKAVANWRPAASWTGDPRVLAGSARIWAGERRWREALADESAYDWAGNLARWHFQASSATAEADVFVAKSPLDILVVDALVRHVPDARFVFSVRNPYALCEGICHVLRMRLRQKRLVWTRAEPMPLESAAARHVVACLALQQANWQRHRQRGALIGYEGMCAEPERVVEQIRALAPSVGDLQLRQRLAVGKGRSRRHDEMLRDMNAEQIARLDSAQIATFNRVFREHGDTFAYFGYPIIGQ